jgi:outer membrane protein OmpA-like peptidoglycan-associated protein
MELKRIFWFFLIVALGCEVPIANKEADDTSDSLNTKLTAKEMHFDSITGSYYYFESTSISQSSSGERIYVSQEEAATILNEDESGSEASKNSQSPTETKEVDLNRTVVRLSHHINTDVSEYYPNPLPDGRLLFTGMDRTGHFEFKIDYSITRSAGGEDGFIADFSNGLSEDARPLPNNLNTNAHEAVTHVLANGDYVMTANYSENLNRATVDQGIATPDIFIFRNKTGRITHLPEPVNSLYGEYDGFMFNGERAIIFASDRPGNVGEYKKKGWLWNENLWGNTDIYVAFKEDGSWIEPINLGKAVNTPFAERTPWLSADGKTLYIASNAYSAGNNDLDIYMFTRSDVNVWDKWTGPVKLKDVCSAGDDWCYRPDPTNGKAYFARSLKLKFKSTLPSREGDGYVRETGWRPGYTVLGAQSAGLRKEYQTDIFVALDNGKPMVTLPDVLFDVDSYKIKAAQAEVLDRLFDMMELNSKYSIEVQGHTDNTGTTIHNQKLSENRAKAVKEHLVNLGADPNSITTIGMGASKSVAPNDNAANKQRNRRVEIYFKPL